MSPAQSLPVPGDLIGSKYRIMSTLGAGGMGVVFEAVHVDTEAHVAIKWLSPELSSTPEATERFKIEARATGRIRHPNVVAIHDIGEHEGNVFMVMELLRGMSLRARLAQSNLDLPAALKILFPVMRGVAAAHAVKVLHRDLKPENIFLAESPDGLDPVPKVLDFGIAKLSWDAGHVSRQSIMTGFMGTYPFMSFEQLHARKDLDGRVDVYALGAVLYNMLSGRLPYEADNPVDLALRMLQSSPEPITNHARNLPAEFVAVLEKSLARERDQRHASVDELAHALEPFADSLRYRGSGHTGRIATEEAAGTPSLATPFVVSPKKTPVSQAVPPVAAPQGKGRLLVGAAALLALAVLIFAVMKMSGSDEQPEIAHKPPPPPVVPTKVEPKATGSVVQPQGNSDWATEPSGGQPVAPSQALPPHGSTEPAKPTPSVEATTPEPKKRDDAKPEGDPKPRRERHRREDSRDSQDSELLIPDWAR